MFSPPLDKPRVVRGIQDVLCSKRVINYRDKASKVMTEVKSGRVSAETMEWVIRGARFLRGKKDLKQRHGGLVFVGPHVALLEVLLSPQGPQPPDHPLHRLGGNGPALYLHHHLGGIVSVIYYPLRAEDILDSPDHPGLIQGGREHASQRVNRECLRSQSRVLHA